MPKTMTPRRLRREAGHASLSGHIRGTLLMTLCAVVVGCSSLVADTAARADTPATVQIFLCTGDTPVDMTGILCYQDQHIFTVDSVLVGSVDSSGEILDTNGQYIGFVLMTGPD